MRVYFISCVPAALKLSGVYVGILDKNEQFMDIDLDEKIFCEIVPADGKRLPVSFIISKEFLESPPENIDVYNLLSCYKISVTNFYSPPSKLNVVFQRRLGSTNALLTLFEEHTKKIMLESGGGFYYEDVPSNFEITDCYHKDYMGDDLIVVEASSHDKVLMIFDEKKAKLVFKNTYNDYEFDGELTLTFNFNDIAKHTGKSVWHFDGQFKMKSYEVTSPPLDLNAIDKKLIPYCFFEEVLCGGDAEKFLSADLKPRAKDIRGYLGIFLDVIPPPFNIAEDYVGLIYAGRGNVYTAKYFKAELNDRLIENIVPLEH